MATLWRAWFGWYDGGIWTNLLASAVCFALGYFVALRHLKCRDCWRPAHVPVRGTVHKVCRKHALELGHTH